MGANEVIRQVVERDCENGVANPKAVLPETHEVSMTANNDCQNAHHCPSELLELVVVETLLKTHNKENHANGE